MRSIEVQLDEVALRLREIAMKARRVHALQHAEAVAEVIDLIAQRRGLELIDLVVAVHLTDRLQRAIEPVARCCEVVGREFALGHCRHRRCNFDRLGDRGPDAALARLELRQLGSLARLLPLIRIDADSRDCRGDEIWREEPALLARHLTGEQRRAEPYDDGRNHHPGAEPCEHGEREQRHRQREQQDRPSADREESAAGNP